MDLLERKREEHRSRALRRVGSVLVCMSLLLTLAFPPQPAKAFAVADDVAIAAIVAAFLASCGMTLHASGMDNGSIAQQVYDMTGEYLDARYGTAEERQQWYDNVKDVGFKDGLLLIGSTAAGALSDMAQWVKERFSIQEDNVIPICQNYSVTDVDGKVYDLSTFVDGQIANYNGVIYRFGDSGYKIDFGNGQYIDLRRAPSYWEYINMDHPAGVGDSTMREGDFLFLYHDASKEYSLRLGNYKASKSKYIDEGGFDILEYLNSLSVDVSPSISIPATIPDTQELTISTGAASDLTLDQALEQILAAIAAGELSATKEIAEAGTATGEDVVPVDEAYPDVGELGLHALADTLTTRFPFSIPWDIAKAVKLLAAPPKTPRFEVDFFAPISYRFGGKLGNTKIVLDFSSEYEIIGQVSRWTSTIGFCLMLASGTKKLIWTT